ncbi:Ger(x)C family spore germination protein [Paenibacillus sp. UNC451MF]|uniref:Ger(x)C family spore germination protein n=1 Tax=Paenibacillus sp. UNC451MF TaxID=1449063 RepID=UPI00048DCCA3|nr:Ger(x)C family spore germination protein [Paenibacillus sp. UNC451MF]
MKLLLCLLITMLALLPGCNDRLDLEDMSIGLLMGIDLDENDRLVYYLSSPVFNKEAKKRQEESGVISSTMVQSEKKMDGLTTALTVRGKVQVLLLGKRLLKQSNWFPLLDVAFRDTKFTVNARIVAVDGPISEVIRFQPKDKPSLPEHLSKLIDTANERNITVKTTLQELHRQMYEKGTTPSISEIKKMNDIEVQGTALLNEQGKYVSLITRQENTLLQILQRKTKEDLSLTVSVPQKQPDGGMIKKKLSILPEQLKLRIDSAFNEGRFEFDIIVRISFSLVEKQFPRFMNLQSQKLEHIINEELQKECRTLIKKFQEAEIDPIGLGLHARAYHNTQWKEVQDHWGEALARSIIRVTFQTEITKLGPVR